jgi:hypothetical protein
MAISRFSSTPIWIVDRKLVWIRKIRFSLFHWFVFLTKITKRDRSSFYFVYALIYNNNNKLVRASYFHPLCPYSSFILIFSESTNHIDRNMPDEIYDQFIIIIIY